MTKSELEMAAEKIGEVDRLFETHKAEGMTMKDACKRAGIKYKFYTKWVNIVKTLYEPDENGELRLKQPAQPVAVESPAPVDEAAMASRTSKVPGRISVPISEENYRILEQLAAKRKMQISQLAAYGLSRAIEQNMI
jgi:hypothetical protein